EEARPVQRFRDRRRRLAERLGRALGKTPGAIGRKIGRRVVPLAHRFDMIRLMSARPFASGNISFGLVSIPVKLYSTGDASVGIHLNMLHKKCGTRLKQQYVCPIDEEVVGKDDIVKGYEYARGQYVLFTEEELKALNPEPTNAVEITEFVPIEKVDPIYFEK